MISHLPNLGKLNARQTNQQAHPKQPAGQEHKDFFLGREGKKKLLHHLSSLRVCQAEEDAERLLVGTAVTGLKRVSHIFFLLFLTLITYAAALIRPLIPLVAEKRRNTENTSAFISLWVK